MCFSTTESKIGSDVILRIDVLRRLGAANHHTRASRATTWSKEGGGGTGAGNQKITRGGWGSVFGDFLTT